jgi:hypothetical protein
VGGDDARARACPSVFLGPPPTDGRWRCPRLQQFACEKLCTPRQNARVATRSNHWAHVRPRAHGPPCHRPSNSRFEMGWEAGGWCRRRDRHALSVLDTHRPTHSPFQASVSPLVWSPAPRSRCRRVSGRISASDRWRFRLLLRSSGWGVGAPAPVFLCMSAGGRPCPTVAETLSWEWRHGRVVSAMAGR